MIKKLTTLLVSGILTVGLVAAASPTVELKQEPTKTIDKPINDCAKAYLAWRHGDNGAELNRMIQTYREDERPFVLMVCITYGRAYQDGERGLT